jgi:hypothetical protein
MRWEEVGGGGRKLARWEEVGGACLRTADDCGAKFRTADDCGRLRNDCRTS